jgi:hypothetical protein
MTFNLQRPFRITEHLGAASSIWMLVRHGPTQDDRRLRSLTGLFNSFQLANTFNAAMGAPSLATSINAATAASFNRQTEFASKPAATPHKLANSITSSRPINQSAQ